MKLPKYTTNTSYFKALANSKTGYAADKLYLTGARLDLFVLLLIATHPKDPFYTFNAHTPLQFDDFFKNIYRTDKKPKNHEPFWNLIQFKKNYGKPFYWFTSLRVCLVQIIKMRYLKDTYTKNYPKLTKFLKNYANSTLPVAHFKSGITVICKPLDSKYGHRNFSYAWVIKINNFLTLNFGVYTKYPYKNSNIIQFTSKLANKLFYYPFTEFSVYFIPPLNLPLNLPLEIFTTSSSYSRSAYVNRIIYFLFTYSEFPLFCYKTFLP